jgi:lipopolysaccharide/colanic/teichoic acid biosynthesis glycosyltransferase
MKRAFDVFAATAALIFAGPVILLAAAGVRLFSRGPAFYLAQRAGVDGRPFTLYKLRTMHIDHGNSLSVVTGVADTRVFVFGGLLRKLKIDELPQLWNIIRGDMSIVGPRPEDLKIVHEYYDDPGMRTLKVRPGLSGIGSIYYYTHGEQLLTGDNPEQLYVEKLLPIKLALELVYIRKMSLACDLQIIARTAMALLKISLGVRTFTLPPELEEAEQLLSRHSTASLPPAETQLRRAA